MAEAQPIRPPSRSSREFGDEIKNLEMEGSKLLSATSALGDSLGIPNLSRSIRRNSAGTTSFSTEHLSSLVDVTEEQKTIDDLKTQLDRQSRETERISRTYLGDKGFRYASTGSLLEQLEIPRNSVSAEATRISSDRPEYLRPVGVSGGIADRELREARKEVSALQTRLNEAYKISDRQREEFRSTLEQLRYQLQRTESERDTALHAQKREHSGQDSLTRRLQQTVEQLESTNRAQEQALLEINAKLDSSQKEAFTMENELSSVRSLLLDRERKRGHPFNDQIGVRQQDLGTLAQTLNQCMNELSADLDSKECTISKLANQVEDQKLTITDRERGLHQEYQQKISSLTADHDAAITAESQRATSARQEIALLQERITMLQQQSEQQGRLKQEVIEDLELKLRTAREEQSLDIGEWKGKKQALQDALDETQRQLSAIRAERDDLVRKKAVIESREEDLKRTLNELTLEQSSRVEACSQHSAQIHVLQTRNEALVSQVDEKSRTIAELQDLLTTVRQESHTLLQNTLADVERQGQEKTAQQSNVLSLQLNAMVEKCQKLSLELDSLKTHSSGHNNRMAELQMQYDRLKEELASVESSKRHIDSVLKDRGRQLEKVTDERDSFAREIEAKDRELAQLLGTKEKLSIQLEEREKNFFALNAQHQMTSESSRSTAALIEELRKERDELQKRMNEKIIETEEIRLARDNLMRRLRSKEKTSKEIEKENQKMREEIQEAKMADEKAKCEREMLMSELRESRMEVASLQKEKQRMSATLDLKTKALNKDIARLKHALKAADQELRMAKKAMKSCEDLDGRAVKVAGKMQRVVTEKRGEVDALQSRVRWLEDCVETVNKERESKEEEKHQLTFTMQKTLAQNQRLSAELKNFVNRNKELNDRVKSLEACIDKASSKESNGHALIERYEQDIARLKLKHQLQIKELERTGRLRKQKEITQKNLISQKSKPCQVKARSSEVNEKPTKMGATQESKAKLLSGVYGRSSSRNKSVGTKSPGTKVKKQRGQTRKEIISSDQFSLPEMFYHERDLSSPVSDLLLASTKENALDSGSDVSQNSDVENEKKNGRNLMRSETKDLCARLEQKIESLTKLGGHLQQENKEMALMMRNEDSKLQTAKNLLKS